MHAGITFGRAFTSWTELEAASDLITSLLDEVAPIESKEAVRAKELALRTLQDVSGCVAVGLLSSCVLPMRAILKAFGFIFCC